MEITTYTKNIALISRSFLSRISSEKYLSAPFVSKWMSPELSEKFITGNLRVNDDPNWKDSGGRV